VAGFCEHGNEPSASIKGRGIVLLAEQLLASQERLYYTEWVSFAAHKVQGTLIQTVFDIVK
jgi:hypothetical protein